MISFWNNGNRYEFTPAADMPEIHAKFLRETKYWSDYRSVQGVWYKDAVATGLTPIERRYVPINRQVV